MCVIASINYIGHAIGSGATGRPGARRADQRRLLGPWPVRRPSVGSSRTECRLPVDQVVPQSMPYPAAILPDALAPSVTACDAWPKPFWSPVRAASHIAWMSCTTMSRE